MPGRQWTQTASGWRSRSASRPAALQTLSGCAQAVLCSLGGLRPPAQPLRTLQELRAEVAEYLQSLSITLEEGPLPLPRQGYELLRAHVHSLALVEPQPTADAPLGAQLCFWQVGVQRDSPGL